MCAEDGLGFDEDLRRSAADGQRQAPRQPRKRLRPVYLDAYDEGQVGCMPSPEVETPAPGVEREA